MSWALAGRWTLAETESLEAKLAQIRADAEKDLPREYQEGAARLVHELDEAVMTEAVNVGDDAPDFVLTSVQGQRYALSDTLQRGPVVLNFYRGFW